MRFFSGTFDPLSGVYTNAPIGAARETCRKAQKQAAELERNAVDTFRAPRPLPKGIGTMNAAASELGIIEDTGGWHRYRFIASHPAGIFVLPKYFEHRTPWNRDVAQKKRM